MKHSILFMCSLLILPFSYSQNILEDAVSLRKFIKENDSELVGNQKGAFSTNPDTLKLIVAIFSKYRKNGFTSPNEFNDMIARNPFFGFADPKKIIDFGGQATRSSIDAANGLSKSTSTPNQGSGFSVGVLADGFARFLVTRTKEELNIAFFQRLAQRLDKQQDLKAFFPAASEQLSFLGSDVYQYKQYLETLRNAFALDMQQLPKSVKSWLQSNDHIPDKNTSLAVQDMLMVSQYLLDKESPMKLIGYLGEDAEIHKLVKGEENTAAFQNLSAGLKVMHLISESLRIDASQSTSKNQLWHDAKYIKESLKDPIILHLYIGLLWERSSGIAFSNDTTVQDLLKSFILPKNTALFNSFKTFVTSFGELGDELTLNMDQLEKKAADANGSTDLYIHHQNYFRSVFDVIEQGYKFKNAFMRRFGKIDKHERRDSLLLEALRHLTNVHYNIRQVNYPQAIYHVAQVVDAVSGETLSWRHELLKYGLFMARVSQADSADQIAAAIEAVALPVQSSAVKKQQKFTLGINAYTAIMGGFEKLDELGENKSVVGITAPVGLEFSFGMQNHGSWSVFFPMLDVGAVTALRFQDDAKKLPEFTWSNIVAPGAYLVYGFYGVPLSIGFGWQQGPQLRKIDKDGNGVFGSNSAGSRCSLFVGVDIPLVQFFRK